MSDTPLKLDKRDFDEMIEVAAVVVNAKHTRWVVIHPCGAQKERGVAYDDTT
jgi:hypothetical protein